ncbi:MAG: 3D-(3,5/4)-trihydroxycyclohexane-1,2-dione acylhydrolase (decyclizing), partial [candidate division Zixibacteria bacterium]|nr:3D-(3,5/4)-trihydroxycyclohexane-1,2-dione acylhydrolase (decyclizing) [candidate division Zixibacteria bacterium]
MPLSKQQIRLTVAQAVVKYLSVQYSERDGVEHRLIPAMFGIFGHGNVAGLGQALFEYGVDLPYYQPCNEQSMVHTASGYAKACHRMSTIACTSSIGPGATNMVSGAATATINRLPVLLLPSDYYVTRYQGPVLQQLEHPISADVSVNDCFRPVSRFFDRISRPEQLLTALPEAMRVLTDPADTGAVTISLPQDLQAHAYDYPTSFFEKRVWRIERRPPTRQRIAEAVALLKSARRPVIIAGGGVHYSEAWAELKAFSERLGIPVAETFGGKGAIRSASEWALGGYGVTGAPVSVKIVANADLVIAVGTRLTDFSTGSQSAFQHPDVKFIGINVAGHDAYKQGALPITADAREALSALTEAVIEAGIRPDTSYAGEVREAKASWEKTLREEIYCDHPGEAMSQAQLLRTLNEEARDGDCVVAAAGSPPGDLLKLWDASRGAACHLEFGFSCMGWEIPAGLGMRMSDRHNEVYVYIGDGTYLMNPTELMTAAQEGLKITVVVSENHGYQCIRALQMARAGRSFGNEFRSRTAASNRLEGDYVKLDLAQNAKSLGARAWQVATPDELRQALQEAREETRPCVIVCETEKYRLLPPNGMWWDIASAEATHDP